ncbi:MAG: SDR family oxidoreductase [Candidatus Hinthialibacter antarcticus]|nr:SDR family oxidoreductase [Candidatus Hinthialibacter antarcticus]
MNQQGTALITGGSRRIGREIALTLARQGWRIALHYNHSCNDAEQLASEIQKNGGECELFCADLSEVKSATALITETFERCPDCNVLINNASIFERAPLLETDEDFFDRHFNINFKTPFFLTRDFARRCKQGSVINLLDTKITQKFSNYFAYTLSKKALFEFTRMAAKELAPAIRVNGVCPGLILPPPGDDEAYIERMQNRVPMKTRGRPQDIASAVLFLLENEFITGDCIFIDGGEHLLK